MDRPDVRYAHNGDVAIAYQVFGEGPISLVCVPGFISNLYWNWELPEFSRMLTGLGSFARVVILDRRGVGLVASGIRCKSAGAGSGFMIRLCGGSDSFWLIIGLGHDDGVWPQLAGWFEQRAAQVLEQAQAV